MGLPILESSRSVQKKDRLLDVEAVAVERIGGGKSAYREGGGWFARWPSWVLVAHRPTKEKCEWNMGTAEKHILTEALREFWGLKRTVARHQVSGASRRNGLRSLTSFCLENGLISEGEGRELMSQIIVDEIAEALSQRFGHSIRRSSSATRSSALREVLGQ